MEKTTHKYNRSPHEGITLFSEERISFSYFSEEVHPNKRSNSNGENRLTIIVSAYMSADKDNVTQIRQILALLLLVLNAFYFTFEDPATELSSAADCVFMLLRNAGFNLVWDVRLEKGAVRLSCTFSKAGKNISHII